MATYSNGSLIGLYGIGSTTGTYGNANVIVLLGGAGAPYQYPILSQNTITTLGNLVGNVVIANSWQYPNGINVLNTLYSNANVASYLPTYSGNVGGTLTTATQTNVTAVGPQVNLTFASNVNANNWSITNLANPFNLEDAATKFYVDNFVQGLQIQAACQYATTAPLTTYTYVNGPLNDGVGATITCNTLGNLVVDGITPVPGDRILVKNETGFNEPYNGIYVLTTQGPSNNFVLTRSADMNQPVEFYGAFTYVQSGTTQAGTTWAALVNNNSLMIIGTTPVPYTNLSPATDYIAGAGITISTALISVDVDNNTIGVNGSNKVFATGNLASANIGTIYSGNLTVSGVGTINSVVGNTAAIGTLTGTVVSVAGNIAGGNLSVAGNVVGAAIFGNGANLTGMYGNANVQSYLPTYAGELTSVGNVYSTGTIIAQSVIGNINITTPQTLSVGNFSVTGNVLAGAGNANIVGNVNAGINVNAAGTVSAVGNVNAGGSLNAVTDIVAGGGVYATTLSSTGSIRGASISVSGAVVAQSVTVAAGGALSTTGNISGGNVSASGNVTGTNVVATSLFGNGGNITGINVSQISGNIVNAVAAGTGIGVSPTTGTPTITNTGVTSVAAGTGISVSAGTGASTITNTGVTSIIAGTNITISPTGGTGAVTINSSGAGTVPAVGAVGSYGLFYANLTGGGSLGGDEPGSSLTWAGISPTTGVATYNTNPSGTWNQRGFYNTGAPGLQEFVTIWVRVA